MKSTILAIDDDEPMLWLISKILKDFEVVCKSDALDAMVWLSKGNFPDLIILDRQMPDLGGIQFLKGLRGSGMYKETPVFFVSSWHNIEMDDELMNLNVKEFISKPFDPEFLLQKVEDHIYKQTITH